MPHNFRFCPYCGGELRGDFRFCPYCGASLEVIEATRDTTKSDNTTKEKPKQTEKVIKPQTVAEPEGFQKRFSLSYIPAGRVTSKERKLNIYIKGVSRDLVFDGSKGTKFGKLTLDKALKLFEKLPRSYPRPLSENDNPIQFEVDHCLHIGLASIEEPIYRIVGIISSGHIYAGSIVFTLLEDASYNEAVEAIKRYYQEGRDFLKNAYKAKERYLEEKEAAEGKYIAKIPGVFIRYNVEAYISSALYPFAKIVLRSRRRFLSSNV